MFTIYQAEGGCASFAAFCLQRGDWATWASSLATLLAVVIALGFSLREVFERRSRSARLRRLVRLILNPDMTSLGGKLTYIEPKIQQIAELSDGDAVPAETARVLRIAADDLQLPNLDQHVGLLVDLPIEVAERYATIASEVPGIRHHIHWLLLNVNASFGDKNRKVVERVVESIAIVRKNLLALGVTPAK
ncbi:hypothetical protein RBI22_15345 [Alcaligenaceae bacterium C4P045]|nr:hypothetical protein [Alcaligenaceae bacterium C4P045]